MTTKLLFLCTGNSCRSQIAEGWVRHLGSSVFSVDSAGIEAHGKNPRAIQVMQEVGVDISGQESTIVTQEMLDETDLLITVCGHADEHCPAVSTDLNRRHMPFDDPAKAVGDESEVMEAFRRTRDEIRRAVEDLIKEFQGSQ